MGGSRETTGQKDTGGGRGGREAVDLDPPVPPPKNIDLTIFTAIQVVPYKNFESSSIYKCACENIVLFNYVLLPSEPRC